MRKPLRVVAVVAAFLIVSYAGVSLAWSIKLPKCSGQLCRDVGCSPDVLCVSGAHVKTCAEVCSK